MDEIDIKIVRILQEDSRSSPKYIADKVGRSVRPVQERIKRLERSGVIRNFTIEIDHELFDGYTGAVGT